MYSGKRDTLIIITFLCINALALQVGLMKINGEKILLITLAKCNLIPAAAAAVAGFFSFLAGRETTMLDNTLNVQIYIFFFLQVKLIKSK